MSLDAARATPGRIDLHTHSTASDGLLAPGELVALAAARGVRVLALTDHDTVAGVPEATARAGELGLRLIPGVELSTQAPVGEVHLLGYFIDVTSPILAAALARFRDARAERAATMARRLASVGAPVAFERVVALAGGGAIGRPHVARALVEAGHATSVHDAFERYLTPGRPGYVERFRLAPEEAVALVRQVGGIPVLAHPHTVADLAELLPRLLAAGLAGLECYYGDYDAAQRERLCQLAARHGLVPTGGTDFHGPGLLHQRPLGAVDVPASTVAALEARCTTGSLHQ